MLMNPGQRQRLAVLAVVAALASSCNFPLRAVERSLPSPQAAPHSQIFPVAERSGNITVTATCSEGTSGPQWASFGMPFPRGVLSDPTQVLVKSVTGEELPADAIELARWRHFTDAAIDGASIRSVLITFAVACKEVGNQDFVVEWGQPRRLPANSGVTPFNLGTRWRAQAPPQTGEHPAVDNYSSDPAAPPVQEPAVWVTIPGAWLMRQNLRGPVAPIRDRRFNGFLNGDRKSVV